MVPYYAYLHLVYMLSIYANILRFSSGLTMILSLVDADAMFIEANSYANFREREFLSCFVSELRVSQHNALEYNKIF